MAISAQCACGKSISAKDEYAGKRVKCPACKEPVTLPTAAGDEKSASSTAKPATVTTTCKCGKSFSAKAALAGKTVKCPGCSKPIKVAGAATTKSKPAAKSPSDSIAVKCSCGKAIKAPAKFAGKSVKCPACSEPLTIPASNREPAMATAASDDLGTLVGSDLGAGELDGDGLGFEDRLDSLHGEGVDTDISGMAGLLDELGLESSKTGQRCPNCKSDIDEDTVICIDCGFNVETGKMLKKSSFVKDKKSDTGVGAPRKEKRKGLFGKRSDPIRFGIHGAAQHLNNWHLTRRAADHASARQFKRTTGTKRLCAIIDETLRLRTHCKFDSAAQQPSFLKVPIKTFINI